MSKISYLFKSKIIKIFFYFLIITSTYIISLHLIWYNKIFNNISIATIDLSNLTKIDAETKFAKNFKLNDKIILSIDNQESEILTSEIVVETDYKKSIERAFRLTNTGNIFNDTYIKTQLLFNRTNLAPVFVINNQKLLETLLIATEQKNVIPIYPSVKIIDNILTVNQGKDGYIADVDNARNDISEILSFNKTNKIKIKFKKIDIDINNEQAKKYKQKAEKLLDKKIILIKNNFEYLLDQEKILNYLSPDGYYENNIRLDIKNIAQKIDRDPQDSVFIIENKRVKEFTPSEEGIVTNQKMLFETIIDSLNLFLENQDKSNIEIEIPATITKPKVLNKDINDLGINSLIGSGFSNFKGSIPNRIHNVNLAQSKFKGILIPPNTTVSFNEILGDVSSFTGYKAAYVIKDGKTVLGDGGGVCQVSTTLFRAVLDAGLPIVERRAHAYRVGYYEQGFGPGLDATVYYPTTDFKFINDTPAHLLLQTTIDLNNLNLKFDIYGTSDGRISTVSKPTINSSVAPADDLYIDDPTLPAGSVKQIEHRAYGAKVVFDYKVTRDGEELINQKFVSNYRPWQAVYLKGVGL